MFTLLRPALALFLLLSLITGLVYPLAVTALAQALLPAQANGSLIVRNGAPVGSALIGQPFSDPKYFWSRPSATAPQPYNGLASSGSNLGPTHPALADAVRTRIEALRVVDSGNDRPVPLNLVTASGSGSDPHISPAAADYQVARVARLRRLPPSHVQALVAAHTEERTFGLLGEPRVDVLMLNLALDAAAPR